MRVAAKTAALSLLAALPALAQMNTAEIAGRVLDAQGGLRHDFALEIGDASETPPMNADKR